MEHNRVLIFSTDDHLYPAGGAEQAFGNITQRMPDIEFDLICARLRKGVKKYEKIGNLNIHRLGFGVPRLDGFILALFGHRKAFKLMRLHRYDLVWSIMASYGAFSAVRVKKKTGLPFLLTLQEGDAFEYIYDRVRFVRPAFNRIFASADAVQAISHHLLKWGKEMGYQGRLGSVIPNGVAVESFLKKYADIEVTEKRNSFGFPSDSVVLFTTSRFEVKNGLIDVLEAMPLLPANVCFVLCGSGSLEKELRSRVKELKLERRVKFMGFVDPGEIPLLMKSSDIFIRPSLTEGLGNAFLEAMASGLITVGTKAGGIPDFLTDGETGFIVEIQNPASIAAVVNKIIALDENIKSCIIERAKNLVVEKYNWDVVTSDMEKLFNEII